MLGKVKLHVAAVVLAGGLAFAACGGEDTGRSGGATRADTRVLTLANGNGGTDELQVFIDKVAELSHGRLRIEPSNGWRQGEKHYETGILEDVRNGKADLGWVGSRALDTVGVKAFDPLHAPFLIDSYELQDEVLRNDLADAMLARMEPAGLTGVAVLPGPLRFLQVDRRIRGPEDLAGLKIAVQDSPVGEATLTALGAQPVEIGTGGSISGLDGIEAQIGSIQGNHYYESAGYTISDAPLWPRPFVVFADTDVWADLASEDQQALRDAGDAARSGMLAATAKDEQRSLGTVCRAGDQVVPIGAAALARLRQAAAPVLARLRSDPATAKAMAAIEALRGSGRAPGLTCPAERSGGEQSALTGKFAMTMRKSEPRSDSVTDFRDTGQAEVRMHVEFADGRAVMTEDSTAGPVIAFDDSYSTFKDVIKFAGENGGVPVTAHWKLDGDELRFTDITGGAADKYVWGHTWTREAP